MTDNNIEYSLSEVLDWPVSIEGFNSEVTASELEQLLAKQNPDALMEWVFQRSKTPEFLAALDVIAFFTTCSLILNEQKDISHMKAGLNKNHMSLFGKQHYPTVQCLSGCRY